MITTKELASQLLEEVKRKPKNSLVDAFCELMQRLTTIGISIRFSEKEQATAEKTFNIVTLRSTLICNRVSYTFHLEIGPLSKITNLHLLLMVFWHIYTFLEDKRLSADMATDSYPFTPTQRDCDNKVRQSIEFAMHYCTQYNMQLTRFWERKFYSIKPPNVEMQKKFRFLESSNT